MDSARFKVYEVARTNAPLACHLLRVLCDYHFRQYQALSISDELPQGIYSPEDKLTKFLRDYYVKECFKIVAHQSPAALLEHMLLWYIHVVQTIGVPYSDDGANYPNNWRISILDKNIRNAHGARDGYTLGRAFIVALQQLQKQNPQQFGNYIHQLGIINLDEPQRIVLEALKPHADVYQKDIYQRFATESRRWRLLPEARELVAVTYSASDKKQRKQWEILLTTMPIQRPHTKGDLKQFRKYRIQREKYQLDFLDVLDNDQLSESLRLRKFELKRKHPEFNPYEPHFPQAFAVGAPVSETQQEHMTPDDWMGLIRKYDDEYANMPMTGGIRQIARQLKARTIEDPQFSYELSQLFDDEVAILYYTAILEGVVETENPASPDWALDLVHRFHRRADKEAKRQIAWALARLAGTSTIPQDILAILNSWMLNDPDPTLPSETIPYQWDSYRNHSFNAVRSVALSAYCQALFNQQDYNPIYDTLKTVAKTDNNPVVQIMILELLGKWQSQTYDNKRTITLLQHILRDYPELINSPLVQRFIGWLVKVDAITALPYVQQMLVLEQDSYRTLAAQIACRTALMDSSYQIVADNLHLHSDPAIRHGAAAVYSANMAKVSHQEICQSRLRILWNDEDNAVREQAVGWIETLKPEHISQFQNFIQEFFNSSAFDEGIRDFVQFIVDSNFFLPEQQLLSLDFLEALLNKVGTDIGDISRGYLFEQDRLVDYLLRLANNLSDDNLRQRAMDLFDRLLQSNSYDARKKLNTDDTEWRW